MRVLWWKTSPNITASLHQMKPLLVPSEWLNVICLSQSLELQSAASNRFLPCMSSSSAPSTHLNKLREDGASQFLTWERASFLCPCFEINRDRRKKKKGEVNTFDLGKILQPGKHQSCGREPRARTLRMGLPVCTAALSAPLSPGSWGKANCSGGPCTFLGWAKKPTLWRVTCFSVYWLFSDLPTFPKLLHRQDFKGKTFDFSKYWSFLWSCSSLKWCQWMY